LLTPPSPCMPSGARLGINRHAKPFTPRDYPRRRRSPRSPPGPGHDGSPGRPRRRPPGTSARSAARLVWAVAGGHLDLTVLGGLQVDQEGHLANWLIPNKMVPGMGGAMDLVTGAKRVIVAIQHTAKGASKIVKKCTLPITSLRPVDLVVTELAVIAFPDGRASLVETAPGVSVAQVVAATAAALAIPDQVPEMALSGEARS
jgi:acetate CoA/acetoacetate CoA-transferase beta subunit